MPLRFRPPFVRAVARHPSHPFALASALPQRGRARLRIFPEKGAASLLALSRKARQAHPAFFATARRSRRSPPRVRQARAVAKKGLPGGPPARMSCRAGCFFCDSALAAAYRSSVSAVPFRAGAAGTVPAQGPARGLAPFLSGLNTPCPPQARMVRPACPQHERPRTCRASSLPTERPFPCSRRRGRKARRKAPGRVRHQQHSPLSGSMTAFSCAAQARLSQEGAPLALFAPTVPARGSHDNHGRLPQPG